MGFSYRWVRFRGTDSQVERLYLRETARLLIQPTDPFGDGSGQARTSTLNWAGTEKTSADRQSGPKCLLSELFGEIGLWFVHKICQVHKRRQLANKDHPLTIAFAQKL